MLRNVGLRKSVEQPVLDLNFAASQIGSNAAPDSRIDFSRGSNAWFVDSDGLVKKSPHNLQVYSQDFDNAAWSKSRITVSTNATTAPDGTLTADKIVETTETGAKYWRDFASAVTGERYFFSVFAKAGERKYLQMWTAFGTGGFFPQVWNIFDVEAGTITGADSDADSVTIEDVGNGWFRCTTSITADGTGLDDIGFGLWDGVGSIPTQGISYTGDGSSGLFVWGAQFSHHSTAPVDNPYVKTEGSAVYAARLDHDPAWFMSAAQEQNLFTNSEMLNETGSTGWTPIRAVVTEDSTEDPNGDTTAEKILEDSTASSSHFVRSPDFTTTEGKSYTASAYVKVAAGTDRLFRLAFSFVDSAFSYKYAQFDLQSGTVQVANADDSSITDVGNGWFRISATETASATADTAEIQMAFVEKGGTADYDGDGTSGFFVWGAQVEVGTSPGTYHRTEGAPYYGEGATPKGLLIEEARTNLVEYSEEFDNADWSKIDGTVSANQVIAPDGTLSADEFIYNSGESGARLVESFTSVSQNTDHTLSCFIKNNGLDDSSIRFFSTETGFIQTEFDLTTGTITSTTAGASSSITDYGNGWFRVTLTFDTGSAATSEQIQICRNSSVTGDGTKSFYVWGAQLEEGSFPTSYIKTTGSTATRNADVATMGPTVAPLKTTGPELITNGGAETGDITGWTTSGTATLTAQTSNAPFGDYAFLFTAGGTDGDKATQTITTEVGKRYQINFYGNHNSGDGANIEIEGVLEFPDAPTLNSGHVGWQERTAYFTATSTSHVIAFRERGANNNASIYVDALSVKEVQGGTELVTNGTFDTDTSGWQDGVALGSSASSESGVFRITGTAAGVGAKIVYQQLSDLVIGRRYRASMLFVGTSQTGRGVRLRLRSANGVTLIEDVVTTTPSTTITFDFTATETNHRLYIRWDGNSETTTSDYVEVDNVSVRELYPFEQYNPAEGTVVCEFERIGNTAFDMIWRLESILDQDFMSVTTLNDVSVYFVNKESNVVDLTFNSIGSAIGETNLTAYTYQQNNYHISSATEGVLEESFEDTSITVPAIDALGIGCKPKDESATGNCFIKRLTYYPYRLNDDVCDSKVTS